MAVHAATVCSTIVILWKEVSVLFKGFFTFKYNDEMAYVLKIFLSMIPVAIVGFLFQGLRGGVIWFGIDGCGGVCCW